MWNRKEVTMATKKKMPPTYPVEEATAPKPKTKPAAPKTKAPISAGETSQLGTLIEGLEVFNAQIDTLPIDLKNHWNQVIKPKIPILTKLYRYVMNNFE